MSITTESVFRDPGTGGRPTSGNAAGPGSVHTQRLCERTLPSATNTLRPLPPHVAESACRAPIHCRATVLQGDHR